MREAGLGLSRADRLKAALRENLKRRKPGGRPDAREKKGTVASDHPPGEEEGSKDRER